jgi:hypothetical protein
LWISDTREVPASKPWGNNITRICTWVWLIVRDGGLFSFDLHLAHELQPSRERSTAVLRQRVDAGRSLPSVYQRSCAHVSSGNSVRSHA